MKKQMFTLVSLLAAASMILVGCGTPATASAPAAGSMEIAVIVKTGNSGYWQNVQSGAQKAAKELQVQSPKLSVTFLGPQSESMVTEEINIVESAIDRGVKAIVLAPSDTSALLPAVQDAKKAGIPVISLLTRRFPVTRPTMCHSWQPTIMRLGKLVERRWSTRLPQKV
jgi:ribose transport system substrate-binding protein